MGIPSWWRWMWIARRCSRHLEKSRWRRHPRSGAHPPPGASDTEGRRGLCPHRITCLFSWEFRPGGDECSGLLTFFRPEPGAPAIRSGTFQHCWCWTDPSRYNSFRIEYSIFFYINILRCHSFTDVHYGNVLNRYFHKIHIYITLKKSYYGRMIQLCVLLQCNLEPFWFLLISIWDMEQSKQEPDANTKRFTGNLFFLLQIICQCFLSL